MNAYDYVKEGGSEFERMDICDFCGKEGKNKKAMEAEQALNLTNCCCTCESADITFYSAEADSELKNIYIFYFPNYNSTDGSDPLDELVFYNRAGVPVTLNVTKQRDESENPTSGQEVGYRMKMSVKEQIDDSNVNWNANPGLYKAKTKFKSNLDYDISEIEKIAERQTVNQMRLTYSRRKKENQNWDRMVTGISAKNILSFNGLDDRQPGDRIYTATVKVYKVGEAAEGFKGKPIVILDGAKEN